MAAQFPAGVSLWQLVGGRWFPAHRASTSAVYLHTVATSFTNGGRSIDAAKDGLSQADFDALKQKFGEAVGKPNPEDFPHISNLQDTWFTLPLVPQGTVVDITPGS
jgi:hypothetical protein